MVILLAFIGAYLGISFIVGLVELAKHNTADAPLIQIIFALVFGLAWPRKLKTR